MSEKQRINDDRNIGAADREMAQALASLAPARPTLSANEILEQALRLAENAQRAARRQTWIWRAATAGFAAALAIVAWIRLTSPPPEHVIVKLVHDGPAQFRATAPGDDLPSAPASCAYLILRQEVLSRGLSALPETSAAPSQTAPLPGEEQQLDDRHGDKNGA